jgi:thiamine biosynthesis lipoprotein
MSLDVGAVGKGYATEQVGEIAKKNGFTSGLISVGGNVRAIGNKRSSNSPWNVGIQNPDMKSEQSNLQVVNLTDLSLVTSGDYERFYTVNGKNYHHIINPETLFPSEYFTAVTIICKDSGNADALSTGAFRDRSGRLWDVRVQRRRRVAGPAALRLHS